MDTRLLDDHRGPKSLTFSNHVHEHARQRQRQSPFDDKIQGTAVTSQVKLSVRFDT